MTIIQGYVKGMLDGVIPREDDKYIALVYNKILLMKRLIEDLVELSKLEARQLRFDFISISTGELIQQIVQKFTVDVQENGINLMVSEDVLNSNLLIQVDLQRIEEVFMNLIYNAIKYTPVDGYISIQVTESEAHREKLVFEVWDTGVGIKEEELPYLFDRYYKVERAGRKKFGSTGLGLSIVKEIIENLWRRSMGYQHGKQGKCILLYSTQGIKQGTK